MRSASRFAAAAASAAATAVGVLAVSSPSPPEDAPVPVPGLYLLSSQVILRHGARTPIHNVVGVPTDEGWSTPASVAGLAPPVSLKSTQVSVWGTVGGAAGCSAHNKSNPPFPPRSADG